MLSAIFHSIPLFNTHSFPKDNVAYGTFNLTELQMLDALYAVFHTSAAALLSYKVWHVME